MIETMDLPDFSKYRYHFRRLWWLPVGLALLFAFVAGGASAVGSTQTASTALLVPEKDATLEPLTSFEASVSVLQSDGTLEAIEAQLGYLPNVSIRIDASRVVTIEARAATASRATASRNAFVDSFRDARTKVAADSIGRAVEDLRAEADALEAALTTLDDAVLATPHESTDGILIGIDRATVQSELIRTQRMVAALTALDPAERADVRVVSLGADEGRSVSTGAVVRTIGGIAAGLFIGLLAVVTLAYLDEKVRTRSDLVALGVPTFGVFNGAAVEVEAPALEAAGFVQRAMSESDGHDYQLGILCVGSGVEPAIRQIEGAASALEYTYPPATRATTAAERLRAAHRSDGVVVLLAPGEVTMRDAQLELRSIRLAGADLLGVALVARDARRARRCR